MVPVSLFPLVPPKGSQTTPVAGMALIDTGARVTCIDRKAAAQAQLPTVGSGKMASATHAEEIVPIFAGNIQIAGLGNISANRAYGANLEPQGIIALIGRDVLKQMILFYNGTDGTFTLSA